MTNTVLGHVPHDGYTEAAYLAEVKRLHPALHFTFRPIQQAERMRLIGENAKLQPTPAALNTAKVLAAKIKSWDLKDIRGDTVPVRPDVIQSLKPALYERLFAVVFGLEPGDEDPEAAPATGDVEASLADQLAAADKGVSVGEAQEARHAGN